MLFFGSSTDRANAEAPCPCAFGDDAIVIVDVSQY